MAAERVIIIGAGDYRKYFLDLNTPDIEITQPDNEFEKERGIIINKEWLTIDNSHLIDVKLPETRNERRKRNRKNKN